MIRSIPIRSIPILAATLAVACLAAPAAQAQRYTPITGAKLAQLCTSRDKLQIEQCTTYIDGLSDAATFYQELLPRDGSKGGKLPAYLCVPSATTGVQLRQSVVEYARRHPENLQTQASGLVLRALRDSYRCQE